MAQNETFILGLLNVRSYVKMINGNVTAGSLQRVATKNDPIDAVKKYGSSECSFFSERIYK